ncbi:MAG: hypothetical protein QM582_08865 [Micropruina sp.]|uniref:hypothetical protein n=1 Tax=Micropruina sp. TaxID=2737536 RepID=UPI0039E4321B
MAALLATSLLAGCVAPSASTAAGCPAGWRAAALWSTQAGAESRLDFVDADDRVTSRPVPYLGFEAAPGSPSARRGDQVVLVSNGDLDRDRTHLITFDTRGCEISAVPLNEHAVMGLSAGPSDSYTSSWLNGAAQVRRYPISGGVPVEVSFPDLGPFKLIRHGDQLFGFTTSDGKDDRPLLIAMDPQSLAERGRWTLPDDVGWVGAALVFADRLYFSYTGKGDGSSGEGTKLGVFDIAGSTLTSVAMKKPAPYLLTASEDAVYIGHTFINPGYRPVSEYVWVSRYRPSTGAIESFDVASEAGISITAIRVVADRLLVLGDTPDQSQGKLLTYALPSMRKLSTVVLTAPAGTGANYLAGLITP